MRDAAQAVSAPEANKAMVRRLVEAINAGEEAAAVEELFAPRTARRVGRRLAKLLKLLRALSSTLSN